MAKSKGGPFLQLIRKYLDTIEFAVSSGDTRTAISRMQALAVLLNAKLDALPFYDTRYTVIKGGIAYNKEKNWIDRNHILLATSVRKWMDEHMSGNDLGVQDDDE
jgi:hypothetical protein